MGTPTRDELVALIKSRGFQGPQRGVSAGDLYYKTVFGHPVCLTNDKLQLFVDVTDHDFNNGTPPHRRVTFEVRGEYREDTWMKVEVYSVPWEQAIAHWDELCDDVLRAWDAMCAHRTVI